MLVFSECFAEKSMIFLSRGCCPWRCLSFAVNYVLLFFSARCICLEGWGLFRKSLPVVRCLCFLGVEGGKEGGRDNCCYHKLVTCCKEGHEAASFLSSVNLFCGFRTPLGASLDEQSNPLLKGKEGLYLLKSLLLETVFEDIHVRARLFSSSTDHSRVSVAELFSQRSNCARETGEGRKEPE